MQIRKFKGLEMSEILHRIRKELGPDAVILTTREMVSRKRNAPPSIEVTAAIDSQTVETTQNEGSKPFENQLARVIENDIYKELQTIKGGLEALRQAEKGPVEVPAQKIHETWLEMKIMLKALTEARQEAPLLPGNQSLLTLYQKLRSCGIDSETASTLCKGVMAELSLEDLWEPEQVQRSLKGIIEDLVKVTGGLERVDSPSERKGARTLALVGPTGVGKTTTIAKLGADQMKQNRPVTLVSFDHEGMKDGEKLMRFGDLLGIPAISVASSDRLRTILSNRRSDELILIDTGGRSHFDQKGLARLKGLTAGLDLLETHLVLSANTKASDLGDMIDRFSIFPIDALVFTKIDETSTYGALFLAMGKKRKPISYLTTGQQVPDDIEVATSKRFADLVLQG